MSGKGLVKEEIQVGNATLIYEPVKFHLDMATMAITALITIVGRDLLMVSKNHGCTSSFGTRAGKRLALRPYTGTGTKRRFICIQLSSSNTNARQSILYSPHHILCFNLLFYFSNLTFYYVFFL